MFSNFKTSCHTAIVSLLFSTGAIAGTPNETDSNLVKLVSRISEQPSLRTALRIREYKLLKDFYAKNQYTLQWYGKLTDNSKRTALASVIAKAEDHFLDPPDYHFSFIVMTGFPATNNDTLIAEITYTDAAICLLHDIAYANDPPYLKFNGLKYEPECINLTAILNIALADGDLEKYVRAIEPINKKYIALKTAYLKLWEVSRQKDFHEITLISKENKLSNRSLADKLKQLGYMTDADTTQGSLDTALRELQKEHNLPVKNVIDPATLKVLNEPLKEKLDELKWNIRWYRWFNCMQNKSYVVVNIPANRLSYFEDGNEKLVSKMVVGKISTPSPTLTSLIKQVIYYPYWNVPFDIAVKEMLPALKHNPAYLDKLRIEVLVSGKALASSAGVNWQSYSRSHFPFALRQKPGCKNALGRLKFDFENPFSVYLHDTDAKNRFLAGRRFFSHGCMRVEKPYELALALGVPAEKIKMDSCLTDMKPQMIPLLKPVPVFVIYATIDVEDGEIRWFEDAYHKREH